MNVKSGHLLIFCLAILGIMCVESHYDDVWGLIDRALPPESEQTQQVQPLMPSPESFYPSTAPRTYQPTAQAQRYESDCWWKYAEEADVEIVDLSRYRAATEADGTPRLLELPVYREDIMAPRAPMSVEFTDVNGNRWQMISGNASLQKEGPMTGDIVREGGQIYFVQTNQDRTACIGRWLLVGRQ